MEANDYEKRHPGGLSAFTTGAQIAPAAAQTTAFTNQGKLNNTPF
jgi:hypothetical protein